VLKGHTGSVLSVSFSPDGRRLASASWDQTVRLWNLATQQALMLQGHMSAVESVSFSPDGRRLASASWDKSVRVWDLATGQARVLKGHTGQLTSVSFSPDGKYLASASLDNTMRLWDLATGQARVLKGHAHSAYSVSFSPDGRRLASASWDGTVRLWHLATGQARALKGHTDSVRSVSFSPDGQRLASASEDQTVRVWNVVTGQTRLLRGHTREVTSVSFSPDSRRLASASEDHTVRLWDLATGQARVLKGHTGSVESVSFSPDGQRLASASKDQTVRLWDLATGEALVLKGHTSGVTSVSFSPDGQRLASGSMDETVRVWETTDTHHLWHLREAAASEHAQQWFAAAFHLNRCIKEEKVKLSLEALSGISSPHSLGAAASLIGLRSLEGRTDLATLHQRRWHASLQLKDWPKVESDFARLRRLKPQDPGLWHRQAWAMLLRSREQELVLTAAACVVAGSQPPASRPATLVLLLRRFDSIPFRRVYAEMERQFADPKDGPTREALVRTRVLVAYGLDAQKAARLASLAKKNSDQYPERADYRETYGAALYRAGRYKEAVKQLTRAATKNQAGGTVWQQCFLAMAHHWQGNKAKAREWLQKAMHQMAKDKKPSWETWLQYNLLRAEAEAVLRSR
jgi:WD40 repeat protein